MNAFVSTALAVLLAAPLASGFTVPALTQSPRGIATSTSTRLFSILGTQEDSKEATGITSTTSFDPAADFEEISIGVLEETFSDLDQSDDIIRDFDGYPVSKDYLAEKMGIEHVDYYTCPEADAFRGFMSDACRVILYPGGETAFYKRIVFKDLDHAREKQKKAPFKLLRDCKGNEVVAAFLSSQACQQLVEQTGVRIPKCYHAKLEPNRENPIESKFSFVLQDFSPADGWYQQWLLDELDEVQATLSMYAKTHAFFWQGSSFWKDTQAAQELEAGVWKSGSYVQPKAQNPEQCHIVASEWATKRQKFEKELSSFDFWDTLGERLQSVAVEAGRHAHPFADDDLAEQYQQYRTFTHGDPKQANLLFRRPTNSELQVGLIDFQWAGFGLAASDIAHFLSAAVHADRLIDGGEETLMRYYFDELQKYLVEYGAFHTAEEAIQKYSYETFVEQYETAVLDKVRLVVAYTWARFEMPVEKDDKEGCARTMNKTSYNKSIPNIVHLMSRCDAILKSRGV
ncbi:Pfam:DUF227 [Seminavis robusta]|uniref:Pfam:DUF227 n=1 Tax=Seminavis robusta TaxID=568900 RepID=A0A9N8HFT7_9STRA|nr:Pfam:DUF227 [Seminavis robusta]|eukprot:Sro591_g172090.1 Pfam:DUF227 (514) ;mRNA; f:49130-50671